MRLGSFVAVALLAVACAPPALEEDGSSASAVVGGTTTKSRPAVGYLTNVIGGENFGSFCTGTLIAPNVVLTAAHCLDDEKEALAKYGQSWLYFGTGDVTDEKLVKVSRFVTHPSWRGWDASNVTIGQHDVAYLVLEKPVSGITPMEPSVKPHRGGCHYEAVGYGITKEGYDVRKGVELAKEDSGTRKSLPFCAGAKLLDQTIETSSAFGATCQGDSGGPLLLRDEDAFFGVVSYGVKLSDAQSGCVAGKRTRYAPLSENEDFVAEALAAAKTKPGPTEPTPSEPTPTPSEPTPAPGASDRATEPYTPPSAEVPSRTVAEHDTPDPAAREASSEDDASTSRSDAESRSAPFASGCSAAPSSAGTGTPLCLLGLVALLARRRRRDA